MLQGDPALQQRQTIVPFTPYEWKYVRQLFRSRRVSDVKECVIILSTWISRTGENTPVAISCSHVLLQAIYADLLAQGMAESEQYMAMDDIRSKHGYAIVRFVNYVNELGQNSPMLKNMVNAVQQFGISKKIVDIRHAITHQTCPDISQLRYATQFGLDWLWTNFWLSDASNAMNSGKAGTANASKGGSPSEYGNQRGREQQHVASIRAFNTWRGKNINLKTELEWSEVSEIFAIKQHILLDLIGFLSCLVRDGHLIQTCGQWKNWKQPPTSSDEKWMVPEPIQSYWEPIFHLIFSLKLAADLVISLMWRLREPTIKQVSKDQITAYARLIIQNFADADVLSPNEWVRILDHLLPVAKNFSKELIDTVMRNCPNLSRKRRNQIHQILTIATVESTNPTNSVGLSGSASSSSDGSKVHTVNDLHQLLKSRNKSSGSESSTNSRNEKTGIELCESDEWIDVPFGMAPGQRVETFTVVIDETSDSRRKRKAFDAAITLDDD